jgi:hypothetical protein
LSGQPVKRGTMAHEHDVYTLLADSAARRRDEAALRQYTPRAQELAARDDHKFYLAMAQRACGVGSRLAGAHVEAETSLQQAFAAFEQIGARWQMARTLAELAELAQAQANIPAARAYFTQALAAFEALRAGPDVHRAQQALTALG